MAYQRKRYNYGGEQQGTYQGGPTGGSVMGMLSNLLASSTTGANPEATFAQENQDLGIPITERERIALNQPYKTDRNWWSRLRGDPDVGGQINAKLLAEEAGMPMEREMARFEHGLAIDRARDLVSISKFGTPYSRMTPEQQAVANTQITDAELQAALAEAGGRESKAGLGKEQDITASLIERLTRNARIGTAESGANIARQRGIYGEEQIQEPGAGEMVKNALRAALIAPVSEVAERGQVRLGPGQTIFQQGFPELNVSPFRAEGSRTMEQPVFTDVPGMGKVQTGKQDVFTPAKMRRLDPITGQPYRIEEGVDNRTIAPAAFTGESLIPPALERGEPTIAPPQQSPYYGPAQAMQEGLRRLLKTLGKAAPGAGGY